MHRSNEPEGDGKWLALALLILVILVGLGSLGDGAKQSMENIPPPAEVINWSHR